MRLRVEPASTRAHAACCWLLPNGRFNRNQKVLSPARRLRTAWLARPWPPHGAKPGGHHGAGAHDGMFANFHSVNQGGPNADRGIGPDRTAATLVTPGARLA